MYAVSPHRQQKKQKHTYLFLFIWIYGDSTSGLGSYARPQHTTIQPYTTPFLPHPKTPLSEHTFTPTSQTKAWQKPQQLKPQRQKPRTTRAPEDKNPRWQKPQTAKAPGNESSRRQKPRGYFPTKDMKTPPLLSFDPVFMDDAQCAETNEKSIFRFLFFD